MRLISPIVDLVRKGPRAIQLFLGGLMLLGSLPLGLYVGFYKCFLGGIVDLLNQAKGPGEVAMTAVIWALIKMSCASFLGVGTGVVLFVIGIMLLFFGNEPTKN